MKSRAHRRIFIKTTKGTKVVIRRKQPSKAKCADCGKALSGVANKLPYILNRLSKTAKRPNRPYGGFLCSTCSRKKILNEVNLKETSRMV